ncbi:Ig-like domain-containing protein [Planktotalea sp.]|uniref:Ig-like domain-containing protein n=1 Tax=Planktotalea sp. TaxID=2029877 RepID=UPI003297037A
MPVDINQYIYGNSLVNYAGGSAQSNVPYWLGQLSDAADNTYAVNGGYGFLRQYADRDEPGNEWGFQGVEGVWNSDTADFDEVSFDSVMITPANFIQGIAPDANYADDTRSPLDATIETVQSTVADQPDAQIFIYEGWADLGSDFGYPVSESQLDEYHAYNAGAYHDWYVDLVDGVNEAVPEANVQLIPVASVMAELFLDGPLEGLTLDDLYVDSAPHGTETVYFLSSLITYPAVFGEAPPADFDVPDTVHPLVAENYALLNDQIAELMGVETSVEPVEEVVINADPVVVNDVAELNQDELIVIDVLANDSDADGDALSVVSVGEATFGLAEIAGGQVVYTPDPEFVGADGFTYTVSDGAGGVVEGRVDVQVLPVEPEPIVVPEVTPEPEEEVEPEVMPEPVEETEPEVAPEPVEETEPEVTPEPVEEAEPEVTPEPVEEVEPEVTPEPVEEIEPEVTPDPEPDTEQSNQGFSAAYFAVSSDVALLSDVDFSGEPTETGSVDALQYLEVTESFIPGGDEDFFAAQYSTVLNVGEAGAHEIFLQADDEARVLFDGVEVLNTSETAAGDLTSVWLDLEEGSHDVTVQYLEVAGEQSLNLNWTGPSTDWEVAPLTGTVGDNVAPDPVANAGDESPVVVVDEGSAEEPEEVVETPIVESPPVDDGNAVEDEPVVEDTGPGRGPGGRGRPERDEIDRNGPKGPKDPHADNADELQAILSLFSDDVMERSKEEAIALAAKEELADASKSSEDFFF